MSKFCNSCGSQLDDSALFCPVCGANLAQPQPQPRPQADVPPQQPPLDGYDMQADIAANKALAALEYIGLLVIALVAAPNSRFVRFHANQALLLGLFAIPSAIPFIGWIWGVFCVVCLIMGIMNAVNGQFKELPLIGKFRIIN